MPAPSDELTAADKAVLLAVARRSIAHGLRQGGPEQVKLEEYPPALREPRATFVTLESEGRLRGCIGTLEARQPLVEDIAEHAYAAAFEDPRFPPLRQAELAGLTVHVSILSLPEPLAFTDEDDLARQLRPGVDGLILRLGSRRATFLPSVWESLADPYVFLAQLKQKAGLPLDFWADDLAAERYTTTSFGDGDTDLATPA